MELSATRSSLQRLCLKDSHSTRRPSVHFSSKSPQGELRAIEEYLKTNSQREAQFLVVRARNLDFREFYSDVGVRLLSSFYNSKQVAILVVDGRARLRFPQPLYRLVVAENSPPGTEINSSIRIVPTSMQEKALLHIHPSSPFRIREDGVVVVEDKVDAEELPPDSNGVLHFVVSLPSLSLKSLQGVGGSGRATGEHKAPNQDSGYERVRAKIRHGRVLGEDEGGCEAGRRPPPSARCRQGRLRRRTSTLQNHSRLVSTLIEEDGSLGLENVMVKEDGSLLLTEGASINGSFDVIVTAIDKGGNSAEARVHFEAAEVNSHAPVFFQEDLLWDVIEGDCEGEDRRMFRRGRSREGDPRERRRRRRECRVLLPSLEWK